MTLDKFTIDYTEAKRKVQILRSYYINCFAFLLLNPVAYILNFLTNDGELGWALWVTLFWGSGMIFYSLYLFIDINDGFSKWEERKIDKIMNQINKKRQVSEAQQQLVSDYEIATIPAYNQSKSYSKQDEQVLSLEHPIVLNPEEVRQIASSIVADADGIKLVKKTKV